MATLRSVRSVKVADAQRFIIDCLMAIGVKLEPAQQHAELILQADRLGHPSHGLNRLEFYVSDILQGKCLPNNKPIILKETQATAWVDANYVLGATGGHFCMDLAIKKAKDIGVGWVASKRCNHNGILGFWAQKAARKGMIGMAFTNTSPFMAPCRSKQAALGTNPICLVAPGLQNETFYLDMATTAVSFGTVEMQRRKKQPLPRGWAQGPDGKETTDASMVGPGAGCLYPLGGSELSGGYKGFGLAGMVEILTGILSGSKYGHHIYTRCKGELVEPADLGQTYVAVDPGFFAPGFEQRVTDCIQYWRQCEPTDPKKPVLVPGDKEKMAAATYDESGTLIYVQDQIRACAELAKTLQVKPMTTIDDEQEK